MSELAFLDPSAAPTASGAVLGHDPGARAEKSETFWIVGHRGSPIAEVENTLESCRLALEEGANALEVDISMSKERELFLWHDDDPNEYRARFRQWGLEPYVGFRPRVPWLGKFRRPSHELTLSEIRRGWGYAEKNWWSGQRVDRRIPTLGELFEWANRERRLGLLFLDVKITPKRIDLVPAFLRRLRTHLFGMRSDLRVVLESAHAEIVADIRKRAPEREVCLDIEPHAGIIFDFEECSAVRAAIRHRARHAAAQKPRMITLWPFSTHRRILEKDLALLREHNAEARPDRRVRNLCSFLINEPEEMEEILALGVSAIQTDRPALLRRIAQERGILPATEAESRALL